jgi:hypothetical protein
MISRFQTVNHAGELDEDELGREAGYLLWERLPMSFDGDDYEMLYTQIEAKCIKGDWRDNVITELRELQNK